MVFVEYGLVFALGALGYGAVEVLYRGFTHWTMMIAGGVCFTLLYLISAKSRSKLWRKCLMGGAAITAVEFIAGAIVNLYLGWNVWDYGSQRLNLLGQICLSFSVLWTLMCLPCMVFCRLIRHSLFAK